MSNENKFDFSEEETNKEAELKKDTIVEDSKKAIQQDARGLWQSIKTFMVELLDFREDTDRTATIQAIKEDIPFKGATAWILICSIFVASVGLNANSTAVVIGAMLISPLMGPILGIGMSIAINDIDTLKKSLINLTTMIVLSLLTAFLFFWLFPLSKDTSELLGRTTPDIRDVLIAFFGGLALIIARTKKGTIASVIFGVAIATALMPPLCTVGYGLALIADGHNVVSIDATNKINGWDIAKGAMYLFTINTIFIALATFLVLKLLRFPMLKYANSAKRKRTARIATLIAIIVMIPAVMTFYTVLKKSQFEFEAEQFIENELEALPNAYFIKKYATFDYNSEGTSKIQLTTFGADVISEETEAVLKQRLLAYDKLSTTKLVVNQSNNRVVNNLEYMEELRTRDSLDLMTQVQKINFLENKLLRLAPLERGQIPFEALVREAKINYENLKEVSYSKRITSDFSTMDTLNIFAFKWVDSLTTSKQKERDLRKLEMWFKDKLKLDTLVVE